MTDPVTSRTRWGVRLPNGTVVSETRNGASMVMQGVAEQVAQEYNATLERAGSTEHAVVVQREEILLFGPWDEAKLRFIGPWDETTLSGDQ